VEYGDGAVLKLKKGTVSLFALTGARYVVTFPEYSELRFGSVVVRAGARKVLLVGKVATFSVDKATMVKFEEVTITRWQNLIEAYGLVPDQGEKFMAAMAAGAEISISVTGENPGAYKTPFAMGNYGDRVGKERAGAFGVYKPFYSGFECPAGECLSAGSGYSVSSVMAVRKARVHVGCTMRFKNEGYATDTSLVVYEDMESLYEYDSDIEDDYWSGV